MLVANNAGINISLNHGRTFSHTRLPIAMMYHVAVDNDVPYHVLGNKQDGPSYRGPSRVLYGGFGGSSITAGDWVTTAGCEDGFAVPDPTNGNIVWGGCDNGRLDRMDHSTGMSRDVTVVAGLRAGLGAEGYEVPLALGLPDCHLARTITTGCTRAVSTSTRRPTAARPGRPSARISTRNDPSHADNSGGMAYDNLTTFDGSIVWAIAESPVKAGVIWVGTVDGQVQVTLDGGAHWTNVTKNIPNLGPWGVVWNVEPSHFDAATAYITVNRQSVGDYDTYVFKTTDDGKSWSLVSGSIPKSVNGSAHCVIEDPVRKGMLYLGTDNALYVSWDDGGHWTRINNNLPAAPVYWLVIQPTFDDLVVATHGRGFYILDDVTPLRELGPGAVARRPPVRAAAGVPLPERRRGRAVDAGRPRGRRECELRRRPELLPEGAGEERLDRSARGNTVIQTLKIDGHAGLNRVWWDLREKNAAELKFLTTPPEAPWADPTRHYGAYGTRLPVAGPIVTPGTYTVRLEAGSQRFSEPLRVLADPHSPGTPASIEAQVAFLRQVRDESTQVTDMVNHLERTRKQVNDLQALLAERGGDNAALDEAVKAFGDEAVALEGKLIDIHNTGRSEDVFRHPMQLLGRIAWMVDEMNGRAGGGSGGADVGPTSQQVAVNDQFKKDIATMQGDFEQFVGPTTNAFNATLKQHGLTLAIQP